MSQHLKYTVVNLSVSSECPDLEKPCIWVVLNNVASIILKVKKNDWSDRILLELEWRVGLGASYADLTASIYVNPRCVCIGAGRFSVTL